MDYMKIDHYISECVVSGNIRRSARMSMMHWQDEDIEEFMSCKMDGDHWTTNISVELDELFWRSLNNPSLEYHSIAVMVQEGIIDGMMLNGEPGIFNSHLASIGEVGEVRCTNPCGEIALEEWENCNLGHLNLAITRFK